MPDISALRSLHRLFLRIVADVVQPIGSRRGIDGSRADRRRGLIVELTEKDRQLLALMQKNAREPVASLARQLGVSRTALQERIQKLEAGGVIEGYAVRLTKEAAQNSVHCFTFAALNNKSYPDVSRKIKAMASIQAVYAITGEWDLIIHVAAETLEKLNREVNALNEIGGIVKTASHVVMETKFNRNIYAAL
ncbi:Lrp/AsnC family transcriptional regulator [Mesorhizobium sp. BR1-1-2]|uniref:Lrp/AsnC family transcriptional regulator n=1 Tax=Mesorhizobium sp. BR1-1-2 TaxID=2876652 RepID=UPI001CCB0989|nr:Lrp/AsnC family transcriptional regulator [Mesorhizobium sp. BR1-1-2]MBZ9963985.1 Lrp/AsnC family transcriptional regulator [Mesorhizobium sp. BR1-1-2]